MALTFFVIHDIFFSSLTTQHRRCFMFGLILFAFWLLGSSGLVIIAILTHSPLGEMLLVPGTSQVGSFILYLAGAAFSFIWWFFTIQMVYRRWVGPGEIVARFGGSKPSGNTEEELRCKFFFPGSNPVIMPWFHRAVLIPTNPLRFEFSFDEGWGPHEEDSNVTFNLYVRVEQVRDMMYRAANFIQSPGAHGFRDKVFDHVSSGIRADLKQWLTRNLTAVGSRSISDDSMSDLRKALQAGYFDRLGMQLETLTWNPMDPR